MMRKRASSTLDRRTWSSSRARSPRNYDAASGSAAPFAAVENGITAGTGGGTTFAPDNRGRIVTFLYRSLAE